MALLLRRFCALALVIDGGVLHVDLSLHSPSGFLLSNAIPLSYPLTCIAAGVLGGSGGAGTGGGVGGLGGGLGEQSCCVSLALAPFI